MKKRKRNDVLVLIERVRECVFNWSEPRGKRKGLRVLLPFLNVCIVYMLYERDCTVSGSLKSPSCHLHLFKIKLVN